MDSEDDLFGSIYARFMPMLRILAKRYGVPHDETEDIVQETFIAFYSHYPVTWEDYKIKAMLCRILKNRCVDYLRRRDTHPTTCWDPVKMEMEGERRSSLICKDALTILLEQQGYQEVLNLLESMKPDWAQVFFLYVIQGRPIEEVSKILGTTDAACRTRLTRGRKYLREKLKRNQEKEEA